MIINKKFTLIDERFVISIQNFIEILEKYTSKRTIKKGDNHLENAHITLFEKVKKIAGIKIFENFLLIKKFSLENLQINIKVGFEEASTTALVYGFLSIIFSTLSVYFINGLRIKSQIIDIKPDFSQKVQQISIKCILKIKIADIIILFLKIRNRW